MAIVLDGIVFGLQLSLLAVGLTLVYGLGGVLNLAHGQLTVVAAVVGAVLLAAGVPVAVVVIVAVAAAAAAARLLDATVLRPVYRRRGERRVLLSLLVTLGVALLIDGIVITTHPFTVLTLPVPGPAIDLLGVRMRRGSVLASVIALMALGSLVAMLRLSRFGRAIRSMIQDEEGAALCGVDLPRTRAVVFVLGGALAGLFAVTQGLIAPVGSASGFDATILALIVTVVGGLGRVSGALVAGLLLGIVHALASFHIGTSVTYVILLTVAMLTILLRPGGILGKAS